jgi:uncharacterized protein YjbI with pentapeptide repeats
MTDLVDINSPLVIGDPERDFQPKSDLTYRSYVGESANEVDLSRSLLFGTLFEKCRFTDTKFDNCDIEDAQFLDCTFETCSFIDADIRSCTFSRCTLESCQFNQALLLDLSVLGSTFTRTSFERASIHDSSFEQSGLRSCSLKHASALHNAFQSVEFEDVRIAECTFLYALMLNCRFVRVQLNAEAVGTIFGMSRESLASVDLIYLGETQHVPAEDTVAALRTSYLDRKWHFPGAMLSVSYGPEHRLFALNDAVDALLRVARNGIGVKRDEFRFLADVAEQLSRQCTLPVAFLVHAAEQTGELLKLTELASSVSTTVQELHNKVYLMLQENLDRYQASISVLVTAEEQSVPTLVTLTYRERPATNSVEVLRIAGQLLSNVEPIPARLVSARAGSWVEVVQTTAMGAVAIYAMLAATNGILTQMIRTRALASALVQGIPKRTVQTLVRTTVLRNVEPMQSRMARSALTALSDLTRKSDALDKVQRVAAGDLDKLQYLAVEVGGKPEST